MPSPRVRADHDALQRIAADFGAQADATRRSLEQLRRQADVLRGGDWVGKGASAFDREMTESVLPAVRRLAAALDGAQRTVENVSRALREAEADAARVLRGEETATGTRTVEQTAHAGAPAAAGPAFIPTIRPLNPRTIAQARARQTTAAQNAAVDRMLSIFDPQVRDLARQSPTLRAQLLALQKKGILFQTGPNSQTIEPLITIDQSLTGADAVAMIAHEAGHAMSRGQEVARVVETPTMTRDQYVAVNVTNNLRNEAMAQFNALQVRAELLAAKAGDIGVPGDRDAAFERIYGDFAGGRITRDQAVDRMGPVMGDLVRDSGPPPQTYRDFAIDFYRKDWDTYIKPTRRP